MAGSYESLLSTELEHQSRHPSSYLRVAGYAELFLDSLLTVAEGTKRARAIARKYERFCETDCARCIGFVELGCVPPPFDCGFAIARLGGALRRAIE